MGEPKADAEADAGLLYGGYGYGGYAPYAYSGYGYAAPYAYSGYRAYSPYAYGGYRAYGYGLGYRGFWKREAEAEPEAEADAGLLYGATAMADMPPMPTAASAMP